MKKFLWYCLTITVLASCENHAKLHEQQTAVPDGTLTETTILTREESPELTWDAYRKARKNGMAAWGSHQWKKSADEYTKAALIAEKLERPGFAAWQYNNAAKALINLFHQTVQFNKTMHKLASLKGKQQDRYRKHLKQQYARHFSILTRARTLLNRAEINVAQKNLNKQKRMKFKDIRTQLFHIESIENFCAAELRKKQEI